MLALATNLCFLKRFPQAQELLMEGVETFEAPAVRAGLTPGVIPPGKLDLWTRFHFTMGRLLRDLGFLGLAETSLRGTLATLEREPSSRNKEANVLCTSFELAIVLRRSGQLLSAEQLYRDILPKLQGSSNYGIAAHNLGELLQERGLVTESRKYLDLAARGHSICFGNSDSIIHQTRRIRSDLDSRLRTCAHCGPVADQALGMKVCQGCKAARYRGAACQKLHWKAHKMECKRIAAENESIAAGGDGAGPSNA